MRIPQKVMAEYFHAKGLPLETAVTFADVTIRDNFSDIASRSQITSFRSEIARGFFINFPIISANMDTVTEAEMAIELARLGAMGAIHQFMPLAEKVRQIRKVKRADSGVINEPITITENETLQHAAEIIRQSGISGILVTNQRGRIVNIISKRDIQFKDDFKIKIKDALPKLRLAWGNSRLAATAARRQLGRSLIVGRPETSLAEAKKLFDLYRIEKLPLVNTRHQITGLIVAKDLKKRLDYPRAVRDRQGRLAVMMTVGIKTELAEVKALVSEGLDVLLLDTARANSRVTQQKVRALKRMLPSRVPLVAGNVDNAEGALHLIVAGVDGIKVGIGPGSACKTREIAGVGMPQITAVAECAAVAKRYKIPIWADGGLRGSADLAKVLVAGAAAGFSGSLFAGTKETPGEVFYENGKKWKIYRGSASLEFQKSRADRPDQRMRVTEGESRRISFKGEVSFVVDHLIGGLQSSMSYIGARDIKQVHQKGKFRLQTWAGYMEGKPEANG